MKKNKIPELTTSLSQMVKINGVMYIVTAISEQNFATLLRNGGERDYKIYFTFTELEHLNYVNQED